MTGKELIEYIKREGLEDCHLGIQGQTPIFPDKGRLGSCWVGLASVKELKPEDIYLFNAKEKVK